MPSIGVGEGEGRKNPSDHMGPTRHGRGLALPAVPFDAGYAQRWATAQAPIKAGVG